MNYWTIYFNRSYHKPYWNENGPSNRSIPQPSSDAENRQHGHRSHAYRNRFKLAHHLEIGQKVLYDNHKQDFTRSQKLKQRRLGPFTITRRITNNTYQIQDDKDPSVFKTVHRNHLVEYYPKEGSLPAMIEEYVPPDYRNDTSG